MRGVVVSGAGPAARLGAASKAGRGCSHAGIVGSPPVDAFPLGPCSVCQPREPTLSLPLLLRTLEVNCAPHCCLSRVSTPFSWSSLAAGVRSGQSAAARRLTATGRSEGAEGTASSRQPGTSAALSCRRSCLLSRLQACGEVQISCPQPWQVAPTAGGVQQAAGQLLAVELAEQVLVCGAGATAAGPPH